jgi:hypothetical protein
MIAFLFNRTGIGKRMRSKEQRLNKNIVRIICTVMLLMMLITACASPRGTESSQRYGQAEVLFRVTLPQALPDGTSLGIEVVDDVTGLAFNPLRYEMTQQDDTNYFVKLPLTIGSVLKYRYIRLAATNAIEYSPQGTEIRFRLADITGPEIIQDSVAAWADTPYTSQIGRVRGQFIDQSNNAPIPNLLVSAQGIQTVTASDGTFTIEGLTLGTHNLVAYSMDGIYETFQQGVTVSQESTTPVFINLIKRDIVSVTFVVETPTDFDPSMPLRFASNLQTLGNAYADLGAGSTTLATDLPELTKVKDGRYSITLDLPEGFDLRYKYTLGDGLWNSELLSNGGFVVRQLIVSKTERSITDSVSTFNSPDLMPVTITVTTPSITPSSDSISLQLNPFGWFEPIPMVKTGANTWSYTLYSPLHLLGAVDYRFCRNLLCDLSTSITSSSTVFTPSTTAQTISTNINGWTNLGDPVTTDVMTEGGGLSPRPTFIAGFEITSSSASSDDELMDATFTAIADEAANVVIIPTTWAATRNSPPYLEPLPGSDPTWTEMQDTIIRAKQQGLQVILFPQLTFPEGASAYWANAKRDEGWWITWYENYHRYLMQVSDWAYLNGVDGIILGDPAVTPSYGNGRLADGSLSNAPVDSDAQWRQLVKDIRAKFSGMVIGAMAYPSSQTSNPAWLDSVDQIYILYSPTLSQPTSGNVADLVTVIRQDLESNLYPKVQGFAKGIIIGLNYPSAANAYSGCTDALGNCLNNWSSSQVDLVSQSQIYNAAIVAAAREPWIDGFVSRNYQGAVYVQDTSGSIYQKPAFYVLWFWYHYILNISS